MWRTSAVFVIPFAMCVAPSAFKNVVSPIRSPYLHQLWRDSHLVFNAKSPMFMRVRRTVPQFTFILSERFVNHKSSVSTGFFRVFPVLFAFGHIFSQKTQQNRRNLFLQHLCLMSILSQDQVRDIALISLKNSVSASNAVGKNFVSDDASMEKLLCAVACTLVATSPV
jgi:hypothetical protein